MCRVNALLSCSWYLRKGSKFCSSHLSLPQVSLLVHTSEDQTPLVWRYHLGCTCACASRQVVMETWHGALGLWRFWSVVGDSSCRLWNSCSLFHDVFETALSSCSTEWLFSIPTRGCYLSNQDWTPHKASRKIEEPWKSVSVWGGTWHSWLCPGCLSSPVLTCSKGRAAVPRRAGCFAVSAGTGWLRAEPRGSAMASVSPHRAAPLGDALAPPRSRWVPDPGRVLAPGTSAFLSSARGHRWGQRVRKAGSWSGACQGCRGTRAGGDCRQS